MIWHSVAGAKDNSLLSCNGSSLAKGEGAENFSEFKVESLVEIFSLAPSRVPMQLSLITPRTSAFKDLQSFSPRSWNFEGNHPLGKQAPTESLMGAREHSKFLQKDHVTSLPVFRRLNLNCPVI